MLRGLGRICRAAYPLGMFGLLNIHKPAGPTSHDIVAGVRRLLGRGVRVGHAGTLDPFAEGVLVVCLGAATRLAVYIQRQPKRYAAKIVLGATSTTDDRQGLITPASAVDRPNEQQVHDCLRSLVGRINQVPPAYSAVHVRGQRAYKLVRKGEKLDLPPRPVCVHEILLQRYEYPHLDVQVHCGTGTYIRALARDIGACLSTGGYCSELTRTAVGNFRIEDSVSPGNPDLQHHLLPAALAVEALPKVTITGRDINLLAHGRSIKISHLPTSSEQEVAILNTAGELLAIAMLAEDPHTLRPSKVFPQ